MDTYHLDAVKVFKYATEPNAPIYRAIMRYLHEKHMRFEHYSTTANDIFQMLKKNDVIPDTYTEANLQESLKSLETWEAVKSRQDKQKGLTIEEFKRKRYLYQITDLGAEVEDLLIRIDELDEKLMGSLDSRQFSRLLKHLELLRDMDPKYLSSTEQISEIWSNVFETHKTLRTNATNYLYHIQEAERENLFNSELFLEFKDTFIQYLGTFIMELNRVKYKIDKVVNEIEEAHIESYVKSITEANRPSSVLYENFSAEKFEKTLFNRWHELKAWFIGSNGSASDIEVLSDKTNEAIRMIVTYANRLSDTVINSQSRNDDYRSLAVRFQNCVNLEDAHELFGAFFGVTCSRSLYANDEIETNDSGNYTNFEEMWNAGIKPLKTPNMSSRGPKGKTKTSKMNNNKAEQQRRLIEVLERKREEEQRVRDLIKDGRIVLAEVEELEPFQRKVILKWLTRTSKTRLKSSKNKELHRTETGLLFRVKYRSTDRIIIKSKDGDLIGPDVEFIFEGEI